MTRFLITAICIQSMAACWAESPKMKTVIVNTRQQLIDAVTDADAGTTVLIAPGTYRGGLHFTQLLGAEGKPIVLAALDESDPPEFKGGASGIHLSAPRWVQLHHLVLSEATGNGLNIDDGGRPERPAAHVLLSGIEVHDIGPNGNRDAIKLSGVDHFIVEGCTIERWGSGGSGIDMVGCHHGQIRGCTFRHRGNIPANGVQTKGGSADIVIARCRFENAGGRAINIGGSTGRDYFRPLAPGYEAKNITVEDCTLIGSMAPIAFVGVDGATVRYNTIYRPTRWVARILQESQGREFVPCRNGSFANNLIAFRSDEVRSVINVGGGTSPESFQFAGNHWFCIDKPSQSRNLQLPVSESDGHYGEDPKFIDPAMKNFQLLEPSPVRDAGVRPEN